MITKRQITTDKKRNRIERKDALKQKKENYLSKWHPKFVIYRCIRDWNLNTKTRIWFETIERRGTIVKPDYTSVECWSWRYRLTLDSKLCFLTRHKSGLETWEDEGTLMMRCPDCGTENKNAFDNEGDLAVCHGGCRGTFIYDPIT